MRSGKKNVFGNVPPIDDPTPLLQEDVGVAVLRSPTQTHLNCYNDVL